MGKFAFIIHPIELSDIYRKFGFLRYFPQKIVEALIKRMSPFKVSEITGIKSPYGETKGWFVTCPLTSRQMVELPLDFVLNKIIQAGKVGQELGADIIGLGAMTSVVGDAGITIAKNLEAAVTTGNSYTVATALEGTKKAAQLMDIDLEKAEVLVVGATGSIGSAAARILARECRYLTLLARDERKLDYLARQIMKESGLAVRCTSNI
ncbi:MAG: shikimate dehydrogenase, partial [Candidatus Syntrophonatronum acetioxidans]